MGQVSRASIYRIISTSMKSYSSIKLDIDVLVFIDFIASRRWKSLGSVLFVKFCMQQRLATKYQLLNRKQNKKKKF